MNLPWITDHTTHLIPLVRIASREPLHISEHFITCGSVQPKLSTHCSATVCLPTHLTVCGRCFSGTVCFGPETHPQMSSQQRTLR